MQKERALREAQRKKKEEVRSRKKAQVLISTELQEFNRLEQQAVIFLFFLITLQNITML